jgi:hypothetical protein
VILIIGIILTILKLKKPINQFIVFDRDTGNVLFTGRNKWPDIVVPFDKVQCFTDHLVGRAAIHFYAKIECLMRPKSIKRGRRTELFAPGLATSWEETMKQWAYIHRFMDKSQPLPNQPEPVWKGIQWFAERKITIEDVMQRFGHLDADGDWIKWDGTSPFDTEDAQQATEMHT